MFSVQATLLLLGVAVWLTAAPAAALTGCTCRGLIFSNSGRVGNYPPNTSFVSPVFHPLYFPAHETASAIQADRDRRSVLCQA